MRLLFIFLMAALTSCKTVKVPNTEFCVDMGELGSTCFFSDSDDERRVEKIDWDTERFGMICTTGESYGEWKAALLKLCSDTNICRREEREKAVALLTKIQSRAERVRARRR